MPLTYRSPALLPRIFASLGCYASPHRALSSARPTEQMRLSRRMSQLDLCSRREADELLRQHRVLVRGIPALLGQKVWGNETDIEIVGEGSRGEDRQIQAVVLHKPRHYVSGQPEDGNVPAVKLLTRENGMGDAIAELFDGRSTRDTLRGYVPAGRLDKDSTGLLVFCRSGGVLAKKLLTGRLEKEYRITLEAAHQPTAQERERGLLKLPSPTENLSIIQKGGALLVGDARPLLPAKARWLVPGEKLRLILTEGRKHQVRRMCRELLGKHVVSLERTRLGPVHAKNLPSGFWRPLTAKEIDLILKMK